MMSTPNDNQDWSLIENVKVRARTGTYLGSDAADDALFVDKNTGTLGTGQNTLSVRPGTALIDGSSVSLDTAMTVDIREGDSNPRRDVVSLASDGTLSVTEGTPDPFAWANMLDANKQTIKNAYQPAPPDMTDTNKLGLLW